MGEDTTRPLRLLSLDGGGIRGLSELRILNEIMYRVKYTLKLDHDPLPADYFDIIGGTSTGGLIAVLLGRLRYSVPKAMTAYTTLACDVFGKKNDYLKEGKFSAEALESAIKSCIKEGLGDGHEEDEMLDPNEGKGAGKCFVCATYASHIAAPAGPAKFRTYSVPRNATYNCKIWEACRATSAAPTFFPRIEVGPDGAKITFIDAGIGCNNPTKELIKEADILYGDGNERKVACIVSIGTGQAKAIKYRAPGVFERAFPIGLAKALADLATDADRTSEEMEERFTNTENLYFRLNVDRGLGDVGLEEWDLLGEVEAYTQDYLAQASVNAKVKKIVSILTKLPDETPAPVSIPAAGYPLVPETAFSGTGRRLGS